MIRIELEPLEQKDIIEYLKYALVQKEKNMYEEREYKFNTSKYDIDRIAFLIDTLSNNKDRTILNKKNVSEGNVYRGSTGF